MLHHSHLLFLTLLRYHLLPPQLIRNIVES